MIKTYKVMLHPNNKQATKLFLNADAARYAYNWAVAAEQENHKQNKPFIKEFELRKQFTKFKKTPEYNTKFDAASNKQKCLAFIVIKTGIFRILENLFSGKVLRLIVLSESSLHDLPFLRRIFGYWKADIVVADLA